MKQRNGFISNSSSSSFVIYKRGLTEEQLKELRVYADFINSLGGSCEADEYDDEHLPYDYEDMSDYNMFEFWIDNCLDDSEIVKFFQHKYGKNVEELY